MPKLTNQFIANRCGNPGVYLRAVSYFQEGAVKDLCYDNDLECYYARVDGSERYTVTIFCNSLGNIEDVDCNCFAFYSYSGYCKHIAAVLLAINTADPQVIKTEEEALVEDLLGFFTAKTPGDSGKKPLKLEVTIRIEKPRYYFGNSRRYVSLKIGETKTYVVKSIDRLISAVQQGEELYFGQNFTYHPAAHTFSPGERRAFDFFVQLYEFSRQADRSVHYSILRGKEVMLTDELLRRLFLQLKESSFTLEIDGKVYPGLVIIDTPPPLQFLLQETQGELQLSLDKGEAIIPLTGESDFVLFGDKVYHLGKTQQSILPPLLKAFQKKNDYTLKVAAPQVDRFISAVLPALETRAALEITPSLKKRLYRPALKPKAYLDYLDGSITARLHFVYGEVTINPFDTAKTKNSGERILVRDTEWEQQVLSVFEQAEFKIKGQVMHLDDAEGIWRFMDEGLSVLQRCAEVYHSDSFRQAGMRPAPRFSGRIGLDWKLDLLELNLELEGIERDELDQIWQSVKEKRKYYRLRDGTLLSLEGEGVAQMARLADALELQPSDLKKGSVKLPKRQALHLDQMIRDHELTTISRDEAVEKLVRLIRHPEEAGYPTPPSLSGVLRDYQSTGFQWLKALSSCGFGGILADDMGLGKTLQAIALILSQRQESQAPLTPVLVVAPASVIYNWEAEIKKFAPELKARVIAGTKAERRELLSRLMEADVLITSYPLLRRDSAEYGTLHFSCCFFDEAQYIKNPHSQTAQCARKIKAQQRFALTGTPMENSLIELWSIFQCIMPGYLHSHQKFINKYGGSGASVDPQVREAASQMLAAKVRPFILRRLKGDVLAELPPKIEHRLLSDLTRDQKKLYTAYLEKLRGEALLGIEGEGFDKSRIKILAGLTRLRQICCHPSLFVENYRGESAKLLQLQELLREAVDGGHRILLFSQFTEMLKLIKEMLNREGYRYLYLDGSVKTGDRLQLVDSFNNGDAEIFLISLKAGGTGLNLTGADIVVQYDLWWNPAVEEQAAGRAHRIGQEKVVQVIRLLAKGTIEEKIYEMQQKKKELIERVIQPGETFLSAMNENDIRHILDL